MPGCPDARALVILKPAPAKLTPEPRASGARQYHLLQLSPYIPSSTRSGGLARSAQSLSLRRMGRLMAGGARNALGRTRAGAATFEIEHLECGALSEPQKGVRRQQRDVLTGGAIEPRRGPLPEILRSAEGSIWAFCETSMRAAEG